MLPDFILVPLGGFTKNCIYCTSLFKLFKSMMPDAVRIWLISDWEPVIGRSAESLLTCSDNLKFISFHLWTFYWSVDFLLWIILPLFIFCYTFEWFTWRSIGKILCRTVYGYNSINCISFCCFAMRRKFHWKKVSINSYMRVIQWSSVKFLCWTNCGCNYF